MPVISPSAFAPPVSAVLREKVRRLERANSVRQAGKGGRAHGPAGHRRPAARRRPADRRPARNRGRVRPLRPHRRPRRRGAGLRRPSDGPLRCGRAGHAAVVPPAVGRVRRPALCTRPCHLVRSGAPAGGHGTARRGRILGDGGRAALPRHRRRAGRDTGHRRHRRAAPVACRREERRACAPAAAPAGAAAKRVRDALADRLGALALDAGPARCRRPALASRTQAQPLRRAVYCRNPVLARGVER